MIGRPGYSDSRSVALRLSTLDSPWYKSLNKFGKLGHRRKRLEAAFGVDVQHLLMMTELSCGRESLRVLVANKKGSVCTEIALPASVDICVCQGIETRRQIVTGLSCDRHGGVYVHITH